ncbi:hypothetical protein ABPG77_006543 [Micractinium sp. CCAP 211/92]
MANIVSLIFAILGAISWIITLGGLAGISSVNGSSQSDTALSWWAVWFQFFLLIFSVLVSVGVCGCARLRTDMYLMCTTLFMVVAWNANIVLDNPYTSGKLESSTGAFLAGCVLILILNMLQIIYWGMTDNGTAPIQFGRRTEAAAGDEAKGAPGSTPSSVTQSPAKPAVTV